MWIFQKNNTLRDILLAVVSSSTGTSLVTQICCRELIALRLETTLSTSTLAVSSESKSLVSTPSLSLLVSWMSLSKIFLTFWSVWSSRERWDKASNNKPLFDGCRWLTIDSHVLLAITLMCPCQSNLPVLAVVIVTWSEMSKMVNIDWVIDSLIGRLIDRLIDWLIAISRNLQWLIVKLIK